MDILGGSLEKTIKFNIPEIDAERTLIQIVKKRKTSLKYPRKAGVPGKEPLESGHLKSESKI